MNTKNSNAAAGDPVWERRCAVLFHVWVQLRYHRKRQRFFDLAGKITTSATVVLGATLIGKALQDWAPLIASAISGFGFLALVFGYGDRKQLHKELAEQAAALIGQIKAVPPGELKPANVAQWESSHALLCANAPPPLKTLTLICEREQSTADGYPEHVKQPWLVRRLAANFC
ncbi:MAG: hypothetical protein FWC42_11060 [Proteobacteria bacterium]|nr:hypothetical protein [Pseudomonadota bacterium]